MAGFRQIPAANRGKHKGEARFRCCWRNAEGRQRGKTIYGRNDAKRFCRDMEEGFINPETGEYFDIERNQVKQKIAEAAIKTVAARTFEALALRFLGKKRTVELKSPSTLEDYRQLLQVHILPTIGQMPLVDIGITEMEDMVRAVIDSDRQVGVRTRNKCVVLCRSIFKYGIELHWCTENPAKGIAVAEIPDPRKGRPLTFAESRRLIDSIEAPYDVMLTIIAYTGCRRGEALALKWSNIDFENATMTVACSFKTRRYGIQATKTKRIRTVPLFPDVIAALRRHAAEQGEVHPDDWLFPDNTGEFPIGGDWLWRRFQDATKKTCLPGYRIHDLRHSFASNASALGIPPAAAQAILGHSNLTTTMNYYTHARDEEKREAVRRIGERLAAKQLPRASIETFPQQVQKAESA